MYSALLISVAAAIFGYILVRSGLVESTRRSITEIKDTFSVLFDKKQSDIIKEAAAQAAAKASFRYLSRMLAIVIVAALASSGIIFVAILVGTTSSQEIWKMSLNPLALMAATAAGIGGAWLAVR